MRLLDGVERESTRAYCKWAFGGFMELGIGFGEDGYFNAGHPEKPFVVSF